MRTAIRSMAIGWLTGVAVVGTAAGAVTLPEVPQGRFAAARESTITRTLRFAGAGERTLVIRLVRGSIAVTAADDATVEFEARKRIRATSDAAVADAEREVMLDIADNAPMVGAIAREPHGEVCGEPREASRRGWTWRPAYQVTFDVSVRVPRGTRVALCTVTGGDIQVDGTSGDFQVDHVNGRITMNGIRGSGYAKTVNGAVRVSFADVPRAASRFKTTNGDVTVTFPATLSADLAMKTFNGGLFTDFDVQPVTGPPPAAVERRGAMTIYRSNAPTRVRVGTGGPEMLFETFNGDVRILRATR